jgi:O-antigen ligase
MPGADKLKLELRPAPTAVERTSLDTWLARIIGALLIAILGTAPLVFGALRDQDFFWIQALGVCAGTLWLIRLWLNPRPVFLPPIVWPLALFCIYGIVRWFTSDIEYLARKEVIRVLYYMMFFVIALNHFQNIKLADVTISILIALGMALSVYALRQYLTGTSVVWNQVRPSYAFRGSGTFIYPNHFAGFAEMLLALGFGYVFLGRLSKWLRIFLAYCLLWLVTGIYFSFSRAGWIVTIGGLLILLPVLFRNRRRQIVAFALCFVFLVGGLVWELRTRQITRRFTDIGKIEPHSALNVRVGLWMSAYQIWQEQPLWGGGPGHFDERFRAYRTMWFQARAG